jgi:hypothetical protein
MTLPVKSLTDVIGEDFATSKAPVGAFADHAPDGAMITKGTPRS